MQKKRRFRELRARYTPIDPHNPPTVGGDTDGGVSESVLAELSQMAKKIYLRKATSAKQGHLQKAKEHENAAELFSNNTGYKRTASSERYKALKRQRGIDRVKSSVKESVLVELSKKTLGSYVNKAAASAYASGAAGASAKKGSTAFMDHHYRGIKRVSGVQAASKKLAAPDKKKPSRVLPAFKKFASKVSNAGKKLVGKAAGAGSKISSAGKKFARKTTSAGKRAVDGGINTINRGRITEGSSEAAATKRGVMLKTRLTTHTKATPALSSSDRAGKRKDLQPGAKPKKRPDSYLSGRELHNKVTSDSEKRRGVETSPKTDARKYGRLHDTPHNTGPATSSSDRAGKRKDLQSKSKDAPQHTAASNHRMHDLMNHPHYKKIATKKD